MPQRARGCTAALTLLPRFFLALKSAAPEVSLTARVCFLCIKKKLCLLFGGAEEQGRAGWAADQARDRDVRARAGAGVCWLLGLGVPRRLPPKSWLVVDPGSFSGIRGAPALPSKLL